MGGSFEHPTPRLQVPSRGLLIANHAIWHGALIAPAATVNTVSGILPFNLITNNFAWLVRASICVPKLTRRTLNNGFSPRGKKRPNVSIPWRICTGTRPHTKCCTLYSRGRCLAVSIVIKIRESQYIFAFGIKHCCYLGHKERTKKKQKITIT